MILGIGQISLIQGGSIQTRIGITGKGHDGLFYLVRDKGNSNKTAKALTVRIGLSVALFVLLMVAYATGLIQPHGVYPG